MVGVRSRAWFPHPPFVLPTPFLHDISPYSFQNNAVQDMILPFLFSVMLLTSFFGTTSAQDNAQIVYDAIHNATVITGTWSSGSQHVLTGSVSFHFDSTSSI